MPSFWAPKSVPDTQTERGRNFQCTKNLSLSLSHSNARFSLSLVLSSQHWYVSGCCKLCWLVDVNSCWVREYSRYSVSLDISRHPITSFKPCTPHPFLLHGPTYLWYFITLSEQSYWKLNYLFNYSEKSLPFGILRRLSLSTACQGDTFRQQLWSEQRKCNSGVRCWASVSSCIAESHRWCFKCPW